MGGSARALRQVQFRVPPLSSPGPKRRVGGRVRGVESARFAVGDARFDRGAGPPTRRRPKKSDPATECLGRSRGGMSTKIHACTDALGNGVCLRATGGQAGDCPHLPALLEGLAPGQVIADTSYDSDKNRAYCAEKNIDVVIPNRPNRTAPAPFDEEQYEDRNKIERFFNRMKRHRRLATRYEKTVVSFLAFWHVAAALDWLR
ncbi:IS5 family transposase [Hymenobacter nivis]|uniref:IS5 family transposase n=1 Tax=Hymenobacter nivis TaxID=1850093 RepID=A0A2Z3GM08_9BACT|nr:IS5 family transposase [Hymenobacter nivis]